MPEKKILGEEESTGVVQKRAIGKSKRKGGRKPDENRYLMVKNLSTRPPMRKIAFFNGGYSASLPGKPKLFCYRLAAGP